MRFQRNDTADKTALASAYKKLVLEFALADTRRIFSFTSGNVGAMPISDADMTNLLEKSGVAAIIACISLLIVESAKFIFYLIIPVRCLGLVIRAALRKANSPKPTEHEITVVSLGDQAVDKDAYFGVLLKHIDKPFNYVKIVGGSVYNAKDYIFVESCLPLSGVLKLSLIAVFSPLVHGYRLIASTKGMNELRSKLLFTLLGLKEINNGTVFGNRVISESLDAHLKSVQVKKLLLPMEGRNWEKKLLRTANIHNADSIAYVHSALTPKQLSLISIGFFVADELPSKIISPSEMSYGLLHKMFPTVSVKKGFFLRGSGVNQNVTESAAKRENILLFALTGSANESELIMDAVANLHLSQGFKTLIRLNPNTSTHKRLAAYANRQGLSLFMQKDTVIPRVCFFRSSSVALDYLKAGVPPVYLRLDEIISNNIFELDNKYPFELIRLDEYFDSNLQQLIGRIGESGLNGAEVANYYLDQRYQPEQLSVLLD